MKKLIYLCTVLCSIMFTVSCSKNNNEKQIYVKLDKVCSFGNESGNDEEIIGMASDVASDNNGNVYVLDFAFKKVKKYSSTGMFVKSYGYGEGKGPGEFLEPRSIDIDSLKNLYVLDARQRTVTVFDSLANVIGIINTKFQPVFVQAFSPKEIFIVGFPETYQGDLIYKYNLSENNSTANVKFGERYEGKYKFEIEHCGFASQIMKDYEKNILIKSDFFPYSIIGYTRNGKKIFELKRDVPFFEPPFIKAKEPLFVKAPSGVWSISQLNKNILVNGLFRVDEPNKKMNLYLDFWDIDKHQFLGSFSQEDLGIKIGRYVTGDSNGYFYNYEPDPYPHVVKYKVIIKYLKE